MVISADPDPDNQQDPLEDFLVMAAPWVTYRQVVISRDSSDVIRYRGSGKRSDTT